MLASADRCCPPIPDWIPDDIRRYVAHTEQGLSIRAIARSAGCHASTVMRQVRRCEQRRDDVLVDLALKRMVTAFYVSDETSSHNIQRVLNMALAELARIPDDAELSKEAPRVLRRLNEPSACLAIANGMKNAVVVRETKDGNAIRTAVVDRAIAEAMAVKSWIEMDQAGRIERYRITTAGRLALKRFLAENEARRAGFTDAHTAGCRSQGDDNKGKGRGRYAGAESPLVALHRRKDKDGRPFLGADLVAAGERLREDYELAQVGQDSVQNWDEFLSSALGVVHDIDDEISDGTDAARNRVSHALADLGPGLGDVVLRCCCYLEGMEAVERRFGWSARSGKIVFRIALTRLKRHYDETSGKWSPLIG